MQKSIITLLNGFGALCALIGFCVFIGAGRNADLGCPMLTNVIPFLMKGVAMMFLGILLANWK